MEANDAKGTQRCCEEIIKGNDCSCCCTRRCILYAFLKSGFISSEIICVASQTARLFVGFAFQEDFGHKMDPSAQPQKESLVAWNKRRTVFKVPYSTTILLTTKALFTPPVIDFRAAPMLSHSLLSFEASVAGSVVDDGSSITAPHSTDNGARRSVSGGGGTNNTRIVRETATTNNETLTSQLLSIHDELDQIARQCQDHLQTLNSRRTTTLETVQMSNSVQELSFRLNVIDRTVREAMRGLHEADAKDERTLLTESVVRCAADVRCWVKTLDTRILSIMMSGFSETRP